MTTNLADLRPSERLGPIPAEVLRKLPVGGMYVWECESSTEPTKTLQITGWDGDDFLYRWPDEGGWSPGRRCPATLYRLFYPLLPALSFSMTREQMATPGDQPSGRMKSVTRRGACPTWCKPGVLFNGWDRSFRVGKGEDGHTKARGLGTFRVVSVDIHWASSIGSLPPAELALEGFPDADPYEFWGMLEKGGQVRDGKTWRIAFEEAR